jgi:hypothetical protein
VLDPVNATSFELLWCQGSLVGFARFVIRLYFAIRLFFSRNTHAVTLINFFHVEYTLQSITLSFAVVTAADATVCFFLTSFSTSLTSGLKSSCGHSSVGLRRKSGHSFHLPDNSPTVIPRETSSATLFSLGICLH